MGAPATKKCQNPNCLKPFVPGHYGDLQVVGSSKEHAAVIGCPSCKGAGTKRGQKCWKCQGKGKVRQTCQEWYRVYWASVRKPPRGISPEAWAKIEKAARKDPLEHACMVTARESALRKGELLGLTWSDILDHQGRIRPSFNVRGQWDDSAGFKPTKTTNGRRGYFLEGALRVLAVVKRGRPEDRVFPFWESRIYEWFVKLQRRIGVSNPETGRPYRWHDLRHTLVSELVHGKGERGLATARMIAGHKNIQTTLGYAEQTDDELISEAEELRTPRKGD